MEYIIILILCIITILILKFAFQSKAKYLKKIKDIGYDKSLNDITNNFPDNRKVCEEILQKLNNKDVSIKTSEDEKSETSFYSVISNSIIIANISNTFTRIQTIAHECIHSTQNRKMLLFNFIFAVIVILPILIALIAFRWFYVIIPIIISVLILISLIIGALVILNTVGKKLYQKL